MEKLLILGASIFFTDAYQYAKQQNIYTIAVDQRSEDYAICKKMADEAFAISTLDVDSLYRLAVQKEVNGIYVGASETNMPVAIKLASMLNIPFYCQQKQWDISTNKRAFKEMCLRYNIPITPYYDIDELNYIEVGKQLSYPVVTKPVDNNGSTGITICKDYESFIVGFEKALRHSKSGDVLVEKFMNCDSAIIHLTMINGKAYYSGMSDKISKKINADEGPVMGFQSFPSIVQDVFMNQLFNQTAEMFEKEGFLDGPIWIEAFTDGERLIFNEMGYRYGGSMTYFPVEYYSGLNQLELEIKQTLNLPLTYNYRSPLEVKDRFYIVPLHVKPGVITNIDGIELIKNLPDVYGVARCHVLGETIEATGNVHQVFCYLHLNSKNEIELENTLEKILATLKVTDENGNDMLFRLMDNRQ